MRVKLKEKPKNKSQKPNSKFTYPQPQTQNKPRDTRPVKHIPKNYPVEEKIEQIYPRLQFDRKLDPHSHPVGHVERELGENIIYDMIKSDYPDHFEKLLIHDIGGNPKRHVGRPNVWCSCPIVDAQDEIRHISRVAQQNASWCTHTVQECDCHAVDIYMSVHSLYYLNATDVSNCLRQAQLGVMYALFHRFPQPIGTLCRGEAQYHYIAPDRVEMTVKGSAFTYRHSAMNWLGNGYFMPVDGAPVAWEVLKELPNSVIIKLVPSRVHKEPPAPFRMFDTVYLDESCVSNVQMTADSLVSKSFKMIDASLPTLPCYSLNRWMMWFGDDTSKLIVDKQLLAHLSRYISGKPRDEDSFRMLVQQATSTSKSHNLPQELIAKVAFASAVIAFYQNVDFEYKMMDALSARGDTLRALTQKLRTFASQDPDRPWILIAVLLISPIIAYLFHRCLPAATITITLPKLTSRQVQCALIMASPVIEESLRYFITRKNQLAGLLFTVMQVLSESIYYMQLGVGPLTLLTHAYKHIIFYTLGLFGAKGACLAGVLHTFNNYLSFRQVPYTQMASIFGTCWTAVVSLATPVVTFAKSIWRRLFPPVNRDDAVRDLIRNFVDEQKSYPIDAPKPLTLGFTPKMPGYQNNELLIDEQDDQSSVILTSDDFTFLKSQKDVVSVHGVLNATNMPVCVATTQQNEFVAVCTRVTKAVNAPEERFEKIFFHWLDINFDILFPDWTPVTHVDFDAWNSRFPQYTQKAHVQARARTQTFDLDYKTICRRKAFIKKEINLPNTENFFKPIKPRLIQSVSHEANVLLGPWMYAFTTKLKTIWNKNHFIFYASSTSSDTVGAFFWAMISEGYSTLNDDDQEKMDAHIQRFHYKIEAYVYKRFGMTRDAKKIFKHQFYTVGYTAHSVRYEVPYKRKSGDPNTSGGNTVINGLVHVFIYCVMCQLRMFITHCYLSQNMRVGALLDTIEQEYKPEVIDTPVVKGAFNGDDAVCASFLQPSRGEFPPEHVLDQSQWNGTVSVVHDAIMYALGLEVKSNFKNCTLQDMYLINFCSARPYPVTNSPKGAIKSLCMGPKIGRVISKFGSTVKTIKDPKVFLKGTALGLVNDTMHVPILYDFVQQVLKCFAKVKAEPIHHDWRYHASGTWWSAKTEAKTMLRYVYDIDDNDIKSLITYLRGINGFPCVLSHPVLTSITAIDMDHPRY